MMKWFDVEQWGVSGRAHNLSMNSSHTTDVCGDDGVEVVVVHSACVLR